MMRKFTITLFTMTLIFLAGCSGQPVITLESFPDTGSQASPLPPTPKTAATPLAPTPAAIENQILEALARRDATAIQTLMGPNFMFGWWRGEILDLHPADAANDLLANHLSDGSRLAVAEPVDLPSLMGGVVPASIPGESVNVTKTVLTTGWGEDGNDEAILFIARQPDGKEYWHGTLMIQGGFTSPDTGGVQVLNNETAGYSFWYPKGYEVKLPTPNEVVILAPQGAGGARERLFISYEAAGGRDVTQVAEELRGQFPEQNIQATALGIAGEQVIVLEKMPGQELNRLALVIHEGRLYRLMFVPDDESIGEAFQQMERLYSTVINTFHFLPFSASVPMGPSLDDFQARLYQALSQRDFTQMQALMDGQFIIGFWKGEGTSYNPAGAVQALDAYITSGSRLTFEEQANLPGLLDGMDPFSILDPAVEGVKAVLVSGLGAEGKDQAIVYIARTGDNRLYWHGILIALDGFSPRHIPSQPTQPIVVHETDVEYILIHEDVNVRAGPGMPYGILYQIYAGQIAQVTGVSANNQWWRVMCSNNTAGDCWVSADRALTEPTDSPGSYPDDQAFETDLLAAIRDRNFSRLSELMGDPFLIAHWQSEGSFVSKEEAINQLQQSHIRTDSPLTVEPNRDLSNILAGQSAMSVLGPEVNGYKAIYLSGWGPNGENQAIVYIARNSSGRLYWHGILVTRGGFSPPGGPFEVIDTNIRGVMAHQDVTIYTGPGSQYEAIGQVAGGMGAKVTGVSLDGLWWRVICPDDTVGNCWVTADQRQTQPIE